MSPEISERSFEDAIELALLAYGPDADAGTVAEPREPQQPPYGDAPPGGYRKARTDDYDAALCLLRRDAVDFILATQPAEWQKLTQHHGAAVKEQFLRPVVSTAHERLLRVGVLTKPVHASGSPPRSSGAAPSTCFARESRTRAASSA